jgi:hypothetical protein
MGSEKLSVPVSSTARRVIAVAIAAALLAVLAIATRPSSAAAETMETDIKVVCESAIGPQAGPTVDIPVLATNADDQLEPGDETSVTISGDFPQIVSVTTYYVRWSEGTWPLPSQVESVDAVSFGTSGGWTPPADWEAGDPLPTGLEVVDNVDGEGGFVKVYFEGGEDTNPSGAVGQINSTPTITIAVTLNDVDDDYYLDWTTFSLQRSNAHTIVGTTEGDCLPCFVPADFTQGGASPERIAEREAWVAANCPGDAVDQSINNVTQVGSPTPTTTTTSTTTTSTTSSTTTSSTTSTTSTTLRPQTGTTTRPSYTG